MALVSRAVEVPVPCPSPARVGSTGTIHYLLEKERPATDQQACASRGSTSGTAARSSKEFVQVCREVVSVSCGQPLLSYKPKRTKSASKVVKPADSRVVSTKSTSVESSPRSVSSRGGVNAARLAGSPEIGQAAELRRAESLLKVLSSPRARGVEPTMVRKTVPLGDGSESEVDKKLPSTSSLEREENVSRGEYPVFQMSNCSLGPKPLPDDYHKALIPFLRAEWDATAKVLKRRQCSLVAKKGVHRRSTSLGSTTSTSNPTTDQKAWQSYTRDSYPPFSASKKHSFFRLASGV